MVKSTEHRSQITAQVSRFYDRLPFNYRESVGGHCEAIRSDNALLSYPVLPALLLGDETSVLDVGCGTGWLSNSIAYHYGNRVTAIDLSTTAINRAKAVTHDLGVDVDFQVADLFEYCPSSSFDLVVSLGVLHHTGDCPGALARLCNDFVAPGGHVFVGLYHSYGRKPFRDHFAKLANNGASEAKLRKAFSDLLGTEWDSEHQESWFRDQVLHPHETQHSLEEVCGILDRTGMTLISTSINRFEPFKEREALFELEKTYAAISRERLDKSEYFPGFFVVLARKD